MNSSSDFLNEFTCNKALRNPGFATIVAFDYYDGPERGLALYSTGEGVRFASLGDSRSRHFRAFELAAISGGWWPEVRALQQAVDREAPARVLVPAPGSAVSAHLESRVFEAEGTGLYVCVGTPDFGKISVSIATEEELAVLRQLGDSAACFQAAHKLIKKRIADFKQGGAER